MRFIIHLYATGYFRKDTKDHHHHIVLAARISLTLSRHSSLSFIALGRSFFFFFFFLKIFFIFLFFILFYLFIFFIFLFYYIMYTWEVAWCTLRYLNKPMDDQTQYPNGSWTWVWRLFAQDRQFDRGTTAAPL